MHLRKKTFVSTIAWAAAVAAQNTTECNSYVIISIRGTSEVQGRSIAFQSMVNDTFAALSGGIEYDAVYPAAPEQTAYLGADDVTRYINAGLQNCPDQKYAILGYSQGATATMLTLMNITDPNTAAYSAIKAVLVVGNPYRVPNATANVDENNGTLTRSYPGAGYNPDNADSRGIPQIYYDNGRLLDICHTEDVICAPAYPNADFIGHLHYGDQNVQNLGSEFLISRLGDNGTSSSTSGDSPTETQNGETPSDTSAPDTGSASMLSIPLAAILGGVLTAMIV